MPARCCAVEPWLDATLRAAEPGEGPPADLALLLDEEHRQVVGALRSLPRRQREVLVLR